MGWTCQTDGLGTKPRAVSLSDGNVLCQGLCLTGKELSTLLALRKYHINSWHVQGPALQKDTLRNGTSLGARERCCRCTGTGREATEMGNSDQTLEK